MASVGADNAQVWLSSTRSGREGRVDSDPARGLPNRACRAQHNYLDMDYLAFEPMSAMAQQLQPWRMHAIFVPDLRPSEACLHAYDVIGSDRSDELEGVP